MNNEFIIGCNYWASNAGTEMWRDWNPEAVENDFKKLVQYGIKYLRVFPNWRDFQPVHPLICGSFTADYRLHGSDLPKNKYYLDEEMLERFGHFCDLAEKYDLKLIVGLLTGYMSGRTFVPPALYEKKYASDPLALLLEQKFVHGMAEYFKNKPAIYAWDLGNECNVFLGAESREEAENWSMTISNAIRTADGTRPIVSGMHSLEPTDGFNKVWLIKDQAENTDILTTHPYPYWCAHCSEGEVTSVQTLMHATCQTKFYRNLGHKPCLAEEIGTMGPMICDNETAGNFMKLNLYSNWANGAVGVMWWCANEQIELMFPPYDRNMCETELGMFDKNGTAKPVIEEVKKFSEWIKGTDFKLPGAIDDAVCLTTDAQDQWGVTYSAYVLAKQAGANIKFADALDELPESDIYLMPSVTGNFVLPAQHYCELKKRVENGATLYISNDRGMLSDFNNLTGLTINNSKTKQNSGVFEFNGHEIHYSRERNYIITADRAEILANDENGMPIFTKYHYGKGTVYYLNFPLEKNMMGICDAFDDFQHEIYKEIFREKENEYALSYNNKYIGITRHNEEDVQWVTLINYSPQVQNTNIKIKDGFICEVLGGNLEQIPPFEMTILKLKKE